MYPLGFLGDGRGNRSACRFAVRDSSAVGQNLSIHVFNGESIDYPPSVKNWLAAMYVMT